MLELEDLRAGYGNIEALHGISLSVGEGEIVTLIGANGAGKTTTLMTISGCVRARTGAIRFRGRDISGLPPHEIVALGLIQSPEGRKIFPRLTVAENLEMGAFTRRDPDGIAADQKRVFELFPILGERRRQTAGTLSGGEQQMLSLARVLARQPRLLIADEISLGLAPLVVEEVFAGLQRVIQLGVSVVLIEQFVHRALQIADRCHVLRRGRLVWSGEASEAGTELVEHYLGGSNGTADVTLTGERP
jgi:branched-chain amino acid transport system ATP-binding protein